MRRCGSVRAASRSESIRRWNYARSPCGDRISATTRVQTAKAVFVWFQRRIDSLLVRVVRVGHVVRAHQVANLGRSANPQSPIPNPQSLIPNP